PVATVALYGPDDTRATKLTVGIVPAEDADVADLRRWFSKGPNAPPRNSPKPGGCSVTIAFRASLTSGPQKLGGRRRSALCLKPLISPACARLGCPRSDHDPPPRRDLGSRCRGLFPTDRL